MHVCLFFTVVRLPGPESKLDGPPGDSLGAGYDGRSPGMKRGYRTPFSYFDLIEMFPKPGCAICTLTQRDVERHVDLMLYGFVSTDEMQAIFQAARGLCPPHGEMVQRNKLGNVIGIARLYVATLNEVLGIMEQTPVTNAPKIGLGTWLRPKDRAETAGLADSLEAETICPVCAALEEFEQEYAAMFSRFMRDARFQAGLRESDGLCLPHFRQVLRRLSGDDVRLLVAIQRDIWARLKAEMELFLDKQDYKRGDIGDEGDSWVRAIKRMAGDKTIFGLRRSGS